MYEERFDEWKGTSLVKVLNEISPHPFQFNFLIFRQSENLKLLLIFLNKFMALVSSKIDNDTLPHIK